MRRKPVKRTTAFSETLRAHLDALDRPIVIFAVILSVMGLTVITSAVHTTMAGFGIKYLYFVRKGFGREYAAGIKNGMELSTEGKKVRLSGRKAYRYAGIQLELWKNLFRMFA